MRRSISFCLILSFGFVFLILPSAETRTLRLKLAGTLYSTTNKLSVDGAFFKRALSAGEDGTLVMKVDLEIMNTMTNVVTNVASVASAILSNATTEVTLNAMSFTTNPSISVSPNTPVCADGSVTDILRLTTSKLANGAAFGSVVFSNGQTSFPLTKTNMNVNTAVPSSTNFTTMCPEAGLAETLTLTTVLTNILATNIVTSLTGTISIELVDAVGEPLVTLFEFPGLTAVETQPDRMRFFALGDGCGSLDQPCPSNATLGEVSFGDAVLVGTIQFTTTKLPRSVAATLHTRGESDTGDVLMDAKLAADNPFPAP